MRINIKNNPTVIVNNDESAKKIKSMARNELKTLLNEKEYKESIQRANRLVREAAFSISR